MSVGERRVHMSAEESVGYEGPSEPPKVESRVPEICLSECWQVNFIIHQSFPEPSTPAHLQIQNKNSYFDKTKINLCLFIDFLCQNSLPNKEHEDFHISVLYSCLQDYDHFRLAFICSVW